MAVYRRGYHRYRGLRTGPWQRFMVLPRFAWRRLFQQRLVGLLIVVSMIWPFLCACFIYITNHVELLQGLDSEFQNFIQVNGGFFRTFMFVQGLFAVFLAALSGPGLIAPDLSNNALPFYFSRPLTRTGYASARLVVLFGMLSIVTLVPGLFLFSLQVGMVGMGWLRENWTLGAGMVAGFSIWLLLVSMVALASSAYVKWRVVAGALVLAFFFILGGVSVMVNGILRVTWGYVLNPAWAVNRIWCALLDVEAPEGPGVETSIAMLAGIVLVLVFVLARKLRPVEVVS